MNIFATIALLSSVAVRSSLPCQELKTFEIPSRGSYDLRADGIVSFSWRNPNLEPTMLNFYPPNYASQPYKTIENRPLIPAGTSGSYTIHPATKDHPTIYTLYDKNLKLIRRIPITIALFEPYITDINHYYLPETRTLVINNKDIEIPEVPEIFMQKFKGNDDELNMYFACTDLKKSEMGAKEGKAFFAWYDQKNWHFPKTPKGYRHAYVRYVSENGNAIVTLSNQSTGASSSILLNGYDTAGAEDAINLSGKQRFFKKGKWSGSDPPSIKTGKQKWAQTHEAVDRWSTVMIYQTTMTNGDSEKKLLRGNVGGKWFDLNQLTENRTVDYRNYQLKGYVDNHLLLQETKERPTKKYVLIKVK